MSAHIYAIHRRSRQAYGAPMMHAELSDHYDIHVSCKRMARLLRADGLRGATLRNYIVTTVSDAQAAQPEDFVQRRFFAERPNQLWVADFMCIPTFNSFLYVAIVLDVYSRKIVGWAMENLMRTTLLLAAINMAILMRRPNEVIHHSSHGCQYTSYAFGKRCCEAGLVPSMGTISDAYDNAMAESFLAIIEREILDRRRFKTQAEAKLAILIGSKVATTLIVAIPHWDIDHRRTTSGSRSRREAA